MICPRCQTENLDIDVRCVRCEQPLTGSGAHRMLGTLVLGQYELVDILGQGGMSVVYKGRHQLTQQEVALKILPPELAAHAQVKSRFLEEAKALAQLDHPNIVHLYNFGQENGCFVLAMQFVRGKTWERMILENGRLDWTVSASIAVDVLKALEYAHAQGVVHRDMKPSNVLVRAADGLATVMDFGIAKMTTSAKLTATGQTMGTVRYMSPEQVRGQEVDFTTDLYSLGATLYESLTGETPFDGNTHFEIMNKHLSEAPIPPSKRGISLPAPIEQALLRSLAKRRGDRHASARDFRVALDAVLKKYNVETADTIRLARMEVPPRDSKPAVGAVVTPPPSARPSSFVSQLADRLEPEPTPVARPSRGRRLWVVLTALLLVGAGVGAVVVLRERGARSPVAPKAQDRPPVFQPAQVSWLSQVYQEAADTAFYSADASIDAQAVAKVYQEALSELEQFVASRVPGERLSPRSVNVAAVAADVLCTPSLYTEKLADGRVYVSPVFQEETCGTRLSHYRITDRTLVVRAANEGLPAAMREGVTGMVMSLRPDLESVISAR